MGNCSCGVAHDIEEHTRDGRIKKRSGKRGIGCFGGCGGGGRGDGCGGRRGSAGERIRFTDYIGGTNYIYNGQSVRSDFSCYGFAVLINDRATKK